MAKDIVLSPFSFWKSLHAICFIIGDTEPITMNRCVHTQATNIVEAGNRLQSLFE